MELPQNYVTKQQLEEATAELLKMVKNTELGAEERIKAAGSIFMSNDRWIHHQIEAEMIETVGDVKEEVSKNKEALDKIRKLQAKRDKPAWQSDDEDDDED